MPSRNSPPRQDGRATRWAGQHERRRREFVDAALSAIAEYGPEVSTEQIAEQAGVARTRLYKHFGNAGDLQRAIATRAAETIITEFEPMWNLKGSAWEMITSAVGAHTKWLAEHANLYRYLTRHSLSAAPDEPDTVTDIKTAVAVHLSGMLTDYLTGFDVEHVNAEPLAFGIIGFVESAATRWLDHPGNLTREELTEQLVRWIWAMLDSTLQANGVHLDPHQPLATPSGFDGHLG